MNLFIDLFSGLAGASSAFVDDSTWRVLRIDNNPALLEFVPETVICDITDTVATLQVIDEWIDAQVREHGPVKRLVVWASPPCDEFSTGFSAPRPTAHRQGRAFSPNMRCVSAVKIIVAELMPEAWFVENVRGAVNDFEPFFGPWVQHHGPFYLWGKFPHVDLSCLKEHQKIKVANAHRHAPKWLRKNKQGQIPLDLSQAVKSALMTQRKLTDW